MEEVIGSIPIRSTKIPFINSYLPAPARCAHASRGCGRVLKFLHFQRQHQFNDLQARFALLLVDRPGVNVKGRATAGMRHQFLCDLDANAERSQVGREEVTETEPAITFSDNSDPQPARDVRSSPGCCPD